MKQYEMFELAFSGEVLTDRWAQIDMTAEFSCSDTLKPSRDFMTERGGKNGSGSIATMGEGVDGTNINLPACQDAFIREARKLGKPLIGIHFDGRPISSDTADECLDAILECWNPCVYTAEAVTDALLGTWNPSGKMLLSTARCAGQIPVYYNHPNGSMWTQSPSIGFADYVDCPHRPRYCFGHGLSYTAFAYSDLTLDKKETNVDYRNS